MTRTSWVFGAALLVVSAVLLCLIPKPEDDLFFVLRVGTDILHAGRLPHADAYSWSRTGTRWDVPEWGAFVLYALAYRAGGLLGTWALLAGLTAGTALAVWARLVRVVGARWAFPLVSLMLLAMSAGLQERPYAFSYLLLAAGLTLLTRGREKRPPASPHTPPPFGGGLLLLPPLCAVWANLHQGVVVLPALILVYGLGDALAGDGARARQMLALGLVCGPAAMASPYGGHVYGTVFLTLRDPQLMRHITEWGPAWSVPWGQQQPFLLLATLAAAGLALSRRDRRDRLPDALAALALLAEALWHVRDAPLFAVGSLIILAPHWGTLIPAMETPSARSGTPAARSVLPPPPQGARRAAGVPAAGVPILLGLLAALYVGTVGLVAATTLRRATAGERGGGLGAAVAEQGAFPGRACRFMDAEGFPARLRLLNDLGDGGFLLWRLPREPVFIDGRLDVYAGRTFDDNLALVRADGSPAWAALARRYDFDCVLTQSRREAAAFAALPDSAADPGWRLVYTDPARAGRRRSRLLLRRRPRFAVLIARCLAAAPEK